MLNAEKAVHFLAKERSPFFVDEMGTKGGI